MLHGLNLYPCKDLRVAAVKIVKSEWVRKMKTAKKLRKAKGYEQKQVSEKFEKL
jgi:hypothetical protein